MGGDEVKVADKEKGVRERGRGEKEWGWREGEVGKGEGRRLTIREHVLRY
jgi:hypothetical protein